MDYSIKDGLYPKEKASVIWNGSACGVKLGNYDLSKRDAWRRQIRSKYNIPDDAIVFGWCGRITRDKKDEYERILGIPIKVFKKGGDFSVRPAEKEINKPIKIVYGGGLLFGRDAAMCKIKDEIVKFNNTHGKQFELYIYTQTPVTDKLKAKIHDGDNSFLMGKVSQEKLDEAYAAAGMALHVESFDLAPRLDTKISFSTKIIDLFRANCCIMAICWDQSSPYKYLKKEDAAICVGNIKELPGILEQIMNNPQIIKEYARKAWDCGVRNHRIEVINQEFKQDFNSLIGKMNLH